MPSNLIGPTFLKLLLLIMNEDQLGWLVCPKCKDNLSRKKFFLACLTCQKKYPIKQGVPILVNLGQLSGHLQNQIRVFDKVYQTRSKHRLVPWQKSYFQRFKSSFPNGENKVVVDCGAGLGYMALQLAQLGAKVIACDLNLSSLLNLKETAKKAGLAERIFLVGANAEELPIKKIADFFIANAILEHVAKEEKMIKEVDRVCKKRAGLMVTVPLAYRYLNPLFVPLNLIHDWRIGHLRRYDLESLAKKFFGWKIQKAYYTGHFFKVMMVLINMLVPTFSEKKMEQVDRKSEDRRWGASNLCVTFKR